MTTDSELDKKREQKMFDRFDEFHALGIFGEKVGDVMVQGILRADYKIPADWRQRFKKVYGWVPVEIFDALFEGKSRYEVAREELTEMGLLQDNGHRRGGQIVWELSDIGREHGWDILDAANKPKN
jgi:hypothetical protein